MTRKVAPTTNLAAVDLGRSGAVSPEAQQYPNDAVDKASQTNYTLLLTNPAAGGPVQRLATYRRSMRSAPRAAESATKGGGVSTRVGASRFLDEQSSSSLALENFANLTALYPRGPLVVGIGYKTDPGDADREPDVSFCGSSCMASQDQKNCKSPTDLHKAPATLSHIHSSRLWFIVSAGGYINSAAVIRSLKAGSNIIYPLLRPSLPLFTPSTHKILLWAMSLVFNSHSRKQERIPSRSSSNTDQQSSVGPSINIAQSLVVPESTTYAQHYGQTFNTTNKGNGPVNNVGHIENASFHLVDGGSLSLLWNSLPKQRDTSGQHNEYLEGSREEDITAILHWVDSSLPGEMVLWIRGAAGVGKSTLARQLTHVLRAHNRLAASVLLSAVPTDARGPESVLLP
ncbi:hypothetical protein NMY22_g4353 [Coprinellus aureogranulatus]|nr:hypothetical protein NMY22_g4353 [Coprinellus aureogranulatus]